MKKLIIALTLSVSLLPACGSDFTPVTPDSGRRAHTAVVVSVSGSDKMYVFGGLSNGIFVNELWEYDISSDIWTQKSPVTQGPGARTYAAAVTDISGNMYVLGGYDGTTRSAPVFYSDMWKYTPAVGGEGTWEEVTSTNMPRLAGHSAVISGTDIYVFGGYNGSDYVSTLLRCDLTGSCTPITPLPGTPPTKRAFHSAVIATDPTDSLVKMYVFGGFGRNLTTGTDTNLDELWAYTLPGGPWTSIPLVTALLEDPKPAARSKHTAVLDINGATPTLFIFGGVGSTSNKIWFYDIGANMWTENPDEIVTAAPASRASHSAVMYADKMYIYGGYISSGATASLNDLWEFYPAPVPDEWTQNTSPPKQ